MLVAFLNSGYMMVKSIQMIFKIGFLFGFNFNKYEMYENIHTKHLESVGLELVCAHRKYTKAL
jgi:hypothetical protein